MVFLFGWACIGYMIVDRPRFGSFTATSGAAQSAMAIGLGYGFYVTVASGVPWGVAALLCRQARERSP